MATTPRDLSSLSWFRTRLALRNTRNKFGKAHPLFVIQSLLFHARALSSLGKNQKVPFRLGTSPGTRIKSGKTYRLDLFLPGRSLDEFHAYVRCLKHWLESGERNFELLVEGEDAPLFEQRSLALLQAEHSLDLSQPEIALRFHTPFSFKPKAEGGPYHPTLPQIQAMLALRAATLAPHPGGPLPLPEAGIALISCLDHFQSSRRLSSEQSPAPDAAKKVKAISGVTGDLYLRGEWQAWLPWLLIAQEFTLGRCASQGQGAFYLGTALSSTDYELPNLSRYEAAWEHFAGRDQLSEARTAPHALIDRDQVLRELAADLRAATYEPDPAHSCQLAPGAKKDQKSARRIALLTRRDAVAHRVLHQILAPRWDRLLASSVHGYRPNRSVETAAKKLRETLAKHPGSFVLTTDLASFFDTIDWNLIETCLDELLPSADRATRHALTQAIRHPLVLADGHPVERHRGLLQGSALSPLLSNLYLRDFDREMEDGPLAYLRYGDDLLMLTPSEETAEDALEKARSLLSPLDLSLGEEKTLITPAADGFTWLGQTFGGNNSPQALPRAKMKRPLILRGAWGFIGLDHESILFRRANEVIDRVPLNRINQLILHGSFGLSSSLLHVCAKRKIPVVLCSPAGHHQRTLAGDEKTNLSRLGRHYAAHHELLQNPTTHLALARSLVEAKLTAYQTEIKRARPAAPAVLHAELHRIYQLLPQASSIESLRGYEGQAARLSFRFFNDRVKSPEFHSEARLPKEKPDRWNALLDFGFSQLFSTLNAALRAHGLNPFLGILHSAADRYESFTADLQEPFRARVEAWALRIVNLKEIRPSDFLPHSKQPNHFVIDPKAFPRFLENFARELSRNFPRDHAPLRDLIEAQVWLVRDWVDDSALLQFWKPEPADHQEPEAPIPPSSKSG